MEKENQISEELQEKCIRVPVLGGHLYVTVCSDPAYPGIDVEYVSDKDDGEKKSRPRVTMEMTMEDDEKHGTLRALVWNDPESEDYTDEIEFGTYGDD